MEAAEANPPCGERATESNRSSPPKVAMSPEQPLPREPDAAIAFESSEPEADGLQER